MESYNWCSRLMNLFEMEDEDDSIIYKYRKKEEFEVSN